MSNSGSVVLSTLEFDVLWESERLPDRHVALDLPSPGKTHTERANLVREAFDGLERRGLSKKDRAIPELVDWLNMLSNPQVSFDSWVWSDHEIRSLAVSSGSQGLLAVVEPTEVWLIPARDTALADAAVSIAGVVPAGRGFSVSVATDLLIEADARSGGNVQNLVSALKDSGVSPVNANGLGAMLTGMGNRGQFGAERRGRDLHMHRADRVVAFHDTPEGRYGYLTRRNASGQSWSTITPADNTMLAQWLRELLDEV